MLGTLGAAAGSALVAELLVTAFAAFFHLVDRMADAGLVGTAGA